MITHELFGRKKREFSFKYRSFTFLFFYTKNFYELFFNEPYDLGGILLNKSADNKKKERAILKNLDS